jgi:NarL family two-component system response regulator LiaR
MKRHVLIYGLIAGVLIAALNLIQYRYLVVEHSIEIYGGLIAAIFSAVGIWLGLRITGRPKPVAVGANPGEGAGPGTGVNSSQNSQVRPFLADDKRREDLRITPRELEILNLIAQGMSNREIAGRLFVSENTVKTHSSRVFDKLGAKRRTQAVQLGKELGLLP